MHAVISALLHRAAGERGAVLVLVAAALFPMIALLAFVVDVSHWFDYSRNLQNRADAAALAGAQELVACGSSAPGDTATGTQSAVGKFAQLYTGAGLGEPAGNLPYTDAQVQSATGWSLSGAGAAGYLNNTSPGSPIDSPLTLRAGGLDNFFM